MYNTYINIDISYEKLYFTKLFSPLNLDKYLTSIISLLKISELISRTELKDDSKIFNVKKFDYNLVKLSQNFDEDMFRKILEIRIEIINEKGIEDEI